MVNKDFHTAAYSCPSSRAGKRSRKNL